MTQLYIFNTVRLAQHEFIHAFKSVLALSICMRELNVVSAAEPLPQLNFYLGPDCDALGDRISNDLFEWG